MTEIHDKRERIIQCATKLFARFGPRKTTIDDIAKEAGIAKGTVYLYFTSRDDILLAVARTQTDLILSSMRSATRAEAKATGKLHAYMTTRCSVRDQIMERLGVSEETLFEAEIMPVLQLTRKEFIAAELLIIRDIVEFGIESGEFRKPKNIDKTCRALASILEGASIPWDSVNGGQIGVSERVALVMDIITNGLKLDDN